MTEPWEADTGFKEDDGRLTLEQALALTGGWLRFLWAQEHAVEWSPIGFWNWGIFQLKDDSVSSYTDDTIIYESEFTSLGFRFSDDKHQHDFMLHECWSCQDEAVPWSDTLGLCWGCLDRIKYPEKTHWRRERAPWSGDNPRMG